MVEESQSTLDTQGAKRWWLQSRIFVWCPLRIRINPFFQYERKQEDERERIQENENNEQFVVIKRNG